MLNNFRFDFRIKGKRRRYPCHCFTVNYITSSGAGVLLSTAATVEKAIYTAQCKYRTLKAFLPNDLHIEVRDDKSRVLWQDGKGLKNER